LANMATYAFLFAALLAVAASQQPPNTPVVRCPEEFSLLGDSCYLVSQAAVTGGAAEAFCRSKTAQLAVVEDQQEMDLLRGSMLNSTVYLGIDKTKHREKFSGSILKTAGHGGYTNFNAGNPNNYGAEECVVADATTNFDWKDVRCTEHHPVLCKTAAVVIDTTNSSTSSGLNSHTHEASPTLRLSCEGGAQLFNGSCFWVAHYFVQVTYAEAEEGCRQRNMQMASVHSQEEHDFILGLERMVYPWIGLNDRAAEGDFVWTDGTAVDYLNWGPVQPDGGTMQNCVFLRDDGFWDHPCTIRQGIACRGEPF